MTVSTKSGQDHTIQIDTSKYTYNILAGALDIPDHEWQHKEEIDADNVFEKYAIKFLDEHVEIK